MEVSGYLIKDEQIIGISPLLVHRLPAEHNGPALWAYFFYDLYTFSNTINIRTDNVLYDAVTDERSKDFLVYKSFLQQYKLMYEKVAQLVGSDALITQAPVMNTKLRRRKPQPV